MKTLRRLIYGEVFSAVSFVVLGFLGLFFFFDLIDELQWVGKGAQGGYQVRHALSIWWCWCFSVCSITCVMDVN